MPRAGRDDGYGGPGRPEAGLAAEPAARARRAGGARDDLPSGPITRPEIAAATNLSKPTVSAAVSRLEQGGLVHAAGRRAGQRGRKPVAYVVSSRAGFVVGGDIGGSNVRVAAADLFGEPICDLKRPTVKGGGRAVGVQILEMVSEVIDQAGAVHGRPLALGISSPGIVDQTSGRVTSLAYNVAPEGGFDPLEVIRDRFDLPVLVENNVNLAAVGEKWFGLARGVSTMVFIAIGAGHRHGDHHRRRSWSEGLMAPPAKSATCRWSAIRSTPGTACTEGWRTRSARPGSWPPSTSAAVRTTPSSRPSTTCSSSPPMERGGPRGGRSRRLAPGHGDRDRVRDPRSRAGRARRRHRRESPVASPRPGRGGRARSDHRSDRDEPARRARRAAGGDRRRAACRPHDAALARRGPKSQRDLVAMRAAGPRAMTGSALMPPDGTKQVLAPSHGHEFVRAVNRRSPMELERNTSISIAVEPHQMSDERVCLGISQMIASPSSRPTAGRSSRGKEDVDESASDGSWRWPRCACWLAACGGSSSSSRRRHLVQGRQPRQGVRQAGRRQRERIDLDVPVQPVQPGRHARVVRLGLRAPRVREHPQDRRGHAMAGDVLAVVERLQDAHVHDPQRSDVERRPAVQRSRRRLHVQRDEERQGDRPQRALERGRRSADERRRQGTTRSSSPSTRHPSRTSTSSRTRRRSCRSTSGPLSIRQAPLLRRHAPRRHRPVSDVELRAAEHQVPEQPPLLAEHARPSGAGGQGGRLSGVPQQHAGQPVPLAGPGAVGRPVHPEHPVVLHLEGSGAPPLLVPAGPERVPVPQPDQPGAEPAAGAPGDLGRHRPRHRLPTRRERLPGAGQPDGRRSCPPTRLV